MSEIERLQAIEREARKMLIRLHDTNDVTQWRGPLAALFQTPTADDALIDAAARRLANKRERRFGR